MVTPDRAGRSMHLLDGRRVVLGDLIAAGLLMPGATLRFTRPRMKESYRALVTDAGRIRLETGEEFRSPSRAAIAAANTRVLDGWHAWTVEPEYRTLDALRQELLDRAVADAPAAPTKTDVDGHASRIHERLREMRRRAEESRPESVTVRELLSLWGARDRGDQVSRIEADLANHGLATRPGFRSVTLDATVHMITAAQEAEAEEETAEKPEEVVAVLTQDEEDPDEPQHAWLTVGNLSALDGVESVPPTATLDEAMTKMSLNDFSQLAVMSGRHQLRGAVTWQSVSMARHRNPAARLMDATVDAQAVPYGTDLFEALDRVRRSGFVFVMNENREVAGIVTTYDIVARYEETANPFILIGDLDRALRRAIAARVPLDDVKALCDARGARINGFDDMSMGDYQRVLENEAQWHRLNWPLDRKTFIGRLVEIRRIRNSVMHFNPDPLPEDTVLKLRNMNTTLRRLAG